MLIGKVVATAGIFTPWSFLIASIIAGLTAFTYAELSSRYPLSAGEAVYLQAGFERKLLSAGVGILIILAGIVSAAAIARGFVGYFLQFWSLPAPLVITLLVSGLVLMMALWLPVGTLARATSLLLLVVFALINLALWKIQHNPELEQAGFSVPRWITVAGFAVSVAFLGYQLLAAVME